MPPYFAKIPRWIYEMIACITGLTLIAYGTTLSNLVIAERVSFTGLGFLFATLVVSHIIRKMEPEHPAYLVMIVGSAVPAIMLDSALIGSVTILFIFFYLLYLNPSEQAMIASGYEHTDLAPNAAFSGTMVLLLFMFLRVFAESDPYLLPFESASFYLGSILGGISVVMMTSRLYSNKYIIAKQLMPILFGAGQMYAGSALSINSLEKSGAIFFLIWIFMKIIDIPGNKWVHYGYKGLLISVVLIVGSLYAMAYPELIAKYTLF